MTMTLDRRTGLSIFERMLMIRHFEEAVIRLYKEGRFVSHYHIYIGQEATGAGVLEALGDKDLICTTHRNHGHIIGRGSDPNLAMAEILGRATGFNGGRSGTLHISDFSRGFLSTSAVVGGCAGLATGAAYGLKVKRESHVSVGFFGDGSLEDWNELRAEAARTQRAHRFISARHVALGRLPRRSLGAVRPLV